MTFAIRPCTPADYDAVSEIFSTVLQQRITAETLRWEDQRRDPKCKYQAWVAEAGGQVVAQANYAQDAGMYHPQKFEVDVIVHPDHRRRGIGGALFETVTSALHPFDPITFMVGIRENWPESIRFAEQRGFREKMRTWESHLDLTTADLSAFAPLVEKMTAQGYVIRPLPEWMAEDPEFARKVYEMGQVVRLDIPSPEPLTPTPYEQWLEGLRSRYYCGECYMVAVKDGQVVGLSNLRKTDEPDVINTGFTGVAREHRGTGLAKALKVRAIEAARAAGYKKTKTWNASTNAKMLAINMAMGFVLQPAWISFSLQLKPE